MSIRKARIQDLATKKDLKNLEISLLKEMTNKFDALRTELKFDSTWLIGTIIASATVFKIAEHFKF